MLIPSLKGTKEGMETPMGFFFLLDRLAGREALAPSFSFSFGSSVYVTHYWSSGSTKALRCLFLFAILSFIFCSATNELWRDCCSLDYFG
jgi:hypothetical protein